MTKVEITDKMRKHEILGPDDYFPATGDDRHQKSKQGCLGDVPQVQTGADIEKLPAQTSTPAVRRNGNPDDELRIRNMDTHRRARKNDSIDATENASTHHTNEKKIQKDCETKKTRPTKKKTLTTWVALVTKVKMDKAQSLTTTRTATYHLKTIPTKKLTTVIEEEEEDLIEYTKRSTDEAMEKMENFEDSLLEQDSQKNEMETGAESGNITE